MILTKYTNVPDAELIAGPVSSVLEQELALRVERYMDMKDQILELEDEVQTLKRHLRWALKFASKPDDMDSEEWAQRMEDAQWSST